MLLAAVYLRRAGILLWRLGAENRKLRKGIRGYEQMEQDHLELGRENRERNRFHGELPILVSNLSGEKTLSGIGRQVVDFTGRSLGASEVGLFLVEGGTLVFRQARGIPVRDLRIRIGEGRIGAVAHFRRIMAAEDFQNLDATSRYAAQRSVARIDTVVAAPLLAHGEVIGVLNVGGNLTVSPVLCKEILLVIAHLGATALENQINFERLEREATTDGLTGLANVRSFKEKMRQEIARSARFGRPCSVFLFDIDNFKHYNDKNGHPAGDECLRLTAELLRKNTRLTDLPARYGGEEFVVLLPETDGRGALAFAEKIRAAIAAAEYPFRERQPLGCVSISGGVASFPEDGKDIDGLISAADQALYRCKHEGRNRVAAADTRPLAASGA
ncbi:MAG: GGDEF domain-containing protein [Candidatus Binatia bacterium]